MVVILVGFFLISKLGAFIIVQIDNLYEDQILLMGDLYTLTVNESSTILRNAIIVLLVSIIPILAALMLVGIVMTGVQTRFLFSPELIKFKLHRISLIQGFKSCAPSCS